MSREEAIEFIKNIIGEESGRCIGKEGFYAELIGYHIEALKMAIKALSQEPTSEKELNKAYTFGHNKGVKAYYNEQLCTVELPEAVFRYILSLVPTEEAEQEPCDDAISREDRLLDLANAIESDDSGYWTNKRISSALRNIPSVTQKGDVKNV